MKINKLSGRIKQLLLIPTVVTGLSVSQLSHAADGEILWPFNGLLDESSSVSAIGQDGTVYFSTEYSPVSAFTPQGNLIWDSDLGSGTLNTSITLGEDGGIFIGTNGGFQALNADGTARWFYNGGGFFRYASSALSNDGQLYALDWFGNLVALNAETGDMLWRHTLSSYDPVSPVIGHDGTIYVNDSGLAALSPEGEFLWRSLDSSSGYYGFITTPSIGANNTIYLNGRDSLYAFAPDGTLDWTFQHGESFATTPVISEQGTLYFSTSSHLFSVSSEGQLLWQAPMPFASNGQNSTPHLTENGLIYVTSTSGWIAAFGTDGAVQWMSSVPGEQPLASALSIAADGTIYMTGGGQGYAIESSGGPLAGVWPKLGADAGNTNNPCYGIPDTDGDKTCDRYDAFPDNPQEWMDTDSDGIGNNEDTDDDNDGHLDDLDAFPLVKKEHSDTDGDGIGDNSDPDIDNDGVINENDLFPFDSGDWFDLDQDGIGDNSDPDDDNDSINDVDDCYPLFSDVSDCPDITPGTDLSLELVLNDNRTNRLQHKNGIYYAVQHLDAGVHSLNLFTLSDITNILPRRLDLLCSGYPGSGVVPLSLGQVGGMYCDSFVTNSRYEKQTGYLSLNIPTSGNYVIEFSFDDSNAINVGLIRVTQATDSDADGVVDLLDDFPNNPDENTDTDNDGLGNNADPDDDNDQVADVNDPYPEDPSRQALPMGTSTPDSYALYDKSREVQFQFNAQTGTYVAYYRVDVDTRFSLATANSTSGEFCRLKDSPWEDYDTVIPGIAMAIECGLPYGNNNLLPAGNYRVEMSYNNNDDAVIAFMPLEVSVTPTAYDDNQDGKADFYLYNRLSEEVRRFEEVNGSGWQQTTLFTLPEDETIIGRADFDGDGITDLFTRNKDSGANIIYNFSKLPTVIHRVVNYVSGWSVVSLGDHNGDGKADIIWRHNSLGTLWYYQMDGTRFAAMGKITTVSNKDWQVVASPDLNGDGKADLLWRNTETGQTWAYIMDGRTIVDSYPLMTVYPSWEIKFAKDFDGDGDDDLFWHHPRGDMYVYLLDSGHIDWNARRYMGRIDPGFGFSADFDGDGDDDILYKEYSDDAYKVFVMDGLSMDLTKLPFDAFQLDAYWEIIQ